MKIINYGKQYIDKDDIRYVEKALRSEKITQGKFVNNFEKNLSKYMGSKYCASVSNGSLALFLSLKVLKLKKKDAVITTPITFASTVTSILMNNYTVDFCDINLKSYTLDLNKLENKLKKNNRIGAVIAVDYAGHPSQWKDLRYLKNKHEFFLINNNCHALGAKYNNEKHYATKYADLVTQSFHPVKHITTGEGGAILTNNKSYYNDILLMRSHSMIRNKSLSKSYGRWHYKINDIGYNFRLSDIQCALGISQLKKIDLFLNRRREIAKIYNEAFTKKPIFITPETEKKVFHSYHLYPLLIDFKKKNISKKNFFQEMFNKKINLQVHYIPVHTQPFMRKYGFKVGKYPVAEKFFEMEVSLPIFYSLKEKDIKYVIRNIKTIIGVN
jgi:dTDP-4-amino-4,6-dideoxygalactose transaminase